MIRNIDILFPSEKDKREAAEHLKVLATSRGWKILEQFMEDELKATDEEMKTTKFTTENLPKLNELQLKWTYLKILKGLPREITAVLLDEKVISDIEFDIY